MKPIEIKEILKPGTAIKIFEPETPRPIRVVIVTDMWEDDDEESYYLSGYEWVDGYLQEPEYLVDADFKFEIIKQ